MNKKLPKKLKIGAHTFKIVEKELTSTSLGETSYEKGIIYISKDLVPSMKMSVLFHEIICHCINTTFTGESHQSHSFMDSISEQLFSVLINNNMLK